MALSVGLCFVATALATPRSAIEAIEVLGPGNPDHLSLRDGTSSSEIALGAAALAAKDAKPGDVAVFQTVKLGDELAVAVQNALIAKGIPAYVAGAATHPWPTSSLQLTVEDPRYERRIEGKVGPKLEVQFRLYDANSRDRIAGDSYVYDLYAKTLGSNILRPPEEFGFEKLEDVQAHPDVAAAALRKGVDMIAQQIVADILADVED